MPGVPGHDERRELASSRRRKRRSKIPEQKSERQPASRPAEQAIFAPIIMKIIVIIKDVYERRQFLNGSTEGDFIAR